MASPQNGYFEFDRLVCEGIAKPRDAIAAWATEITAADREKLLSLVQEFELSVSSPVDARLKAVPTNHSNRVALDGWPLVFAILGSCGLAGGVAFGFVKESSLLFGIGVCAAIVFFSVMVVLLRRRAKSCLSMLGLEYDPTHPHANRDDYMAIQGFVLIGVAGVLLAFVVTFAITLVWLIDRVDRFLFGDQDSLTNAIARAAIACVIGSACWIVMTKCRTATVRVLKSVRGYFAFHLAPILTLSLYNRPSKEQVTPLTNWGLMKSYGSWLIVSLLCFGVVWQHDFLLDVPNVDVGSKRVKLARGVVSLLQHAKSRRTTLVLFCALSGAMCIAAFARRLLIHAKFNRVGLITFAIFMPILLFYLATAWITRGLS